MPKNTANSRPVIRLRPGVKKPIVPGAPPWIFSNDIAMTDEAKSLEPGADVRLETDSGQSLGCYLFNRHPLICARQISSDPDIVIDSDFMVERLRCALDIREALFGSPHYRLVHAEADGLPGTVIDRLGDLLVVQVNVAGMERLLPTLLEALDDVVPSRTILLRNDSQARALEGLGADVSFVKGALDAAVTVHENGAKFRADPRGGQKTGWFFDQRDNRAFAARLARGGRVLDCYSYTGGFAIQAALAGAASVVAVDRSQSALDLAREAAGLNGVAERCDFVKAEVFNDLHHRARRDERYDLVIVDPPAFVKTKKDYWQGIKGYRKLARLATRLVSPGGYLMACSCSHHVDPDTFATQIRRALGEAGRGGRLLRRSGAGPDHPVHPWLPETEYLKSLTFALD